MSRKSKGIVLIVTMLLVVIIIMLFALIIDIATSSLKLGSAYSNTSQAYAAAVSGLEYARHQLYQDSRWMQTFSDDNVVTISYTGADNQKIDVIEEHGQVKGYIGYSDDDFPNRSTFLIRFKTPQGSLANSSFSVRSGEKYTILSESCNNMGGSSEVDISGNKTIAAVPPGKILIVAEGISKGIVRRAEALMEISDLPGMDASTISRKNIKAKLAGVNSMFWIDSVKSKGIIRTPEKIKCEAVRQNCMFVKNDGDVYAKALVLNKNKDIYESFGINLITDTSSTEELLKNEFFAGMTYDKLSTGSMGASSCPAGAYIYDYSAKKWYHFDDLSFNGKKAIKAKLSGNPSANVPANFGFSSELETPLPVVNIKGRTKISGDVLIAAVDNMEKMRDEDGKITITSSSISKSAAPRVNFTDDDSVLYIKGHGDKGLAVIQGSVNGSGKLISNGSIYMQGGSYFETGKNTGVGIYADRDVNIIPASGYDAELKEKIELAWQELVKTDKNIPDEKNEDGEIIRAAMDIAVEKFAKIELDKDETLEKYLNSRGCKGDDQKKFLESIIAQNSSYLAEAGADPGIEPTTVERIDTFDMFNNNTLNGVEPNGYGGFAEGPYSLAQCGEEETDFVDWHSIEPGENGIAAKKTDAWFPNTRFSFATAFTTPKTNYPNSHLGFDDDTEYMVFWVHDNNVFESSNELNDLFVCIPQNPSSAVPVQIKYCKGISLSCVLTPGSEGHMSSTCNDIKTQKITDEKILSKFGFEKYADNNGDFKINMKNIFEALDVELSGDADYNAMKQVFNDNKDVNWNDTLKIEVKSDDGSRRRYARTFTPVLDDAITSLQQGLTLKEGIIVTPTNNDTTIKGMIFSRNGDFNTDLQDGTLTIRGGVIAFKGGINLDGGAVNLCYDPEYMNFYTSGKGCVMDYLFRKIY